MRAGWLPWGAMGLLDPLGRPVSILRSFLAGGASGGGLLMAATAIALLLANSPVAERYTTFFRAKLFGLEVAHWINDGLMSLYFLLVGLEIKREFLQGQLATWPRRTLPLVAALGGMLVPAMIYVAFNATSGPALRGWAIPTATDIAFALGVLGLLGRRVPVSLALFLTTLAIADDLGAVLVIALFYTDAFEPVALAAAGAILAALVALNLLGIRRLVVFLVMGALLWVAVLKSGIHATVAGVVLAMTVPIDGHEAGGAAQSPLHRLEHALQPWVAFFIIPVFALANAGVALTRLSLADAVAPLTLGIAAALFVGKQLGVFLFSLGAIRLGLAARPAGATLLQLYGVALLCGIGFTMSLFIGLLAVPGPLGQEQVKLGILAGSGLSAVSGAAILWLAGRDSSRAGAA